ncbi:hypothetical protein [Streptomyces sp. NPDC005303]|uniref:hypothetical protein n=1 Tax=Streptomyces sp. NPDC005303 TaxID=3155713 RepID=UPI0033A90A10
MSDKSALAVNRSLVAAVARKAQRVGEAAPSVRGSDWRLAVVTADNGDGTIAADGIPNIRCMESYVQPAVGDLIRIDQSSSGNWLAMGRAATTPQTWTTLTLASGYQNPGHGYTAAYLREGRRIWLRGRISPTSGTIADGATLLTLPAAIRPEGATAISWSVSRDAAVVPAAIRLEILTTGVIRTFQSSNLPTWVALDGISYTI